jgi:predicted kinase
MSPPLLIIITGAPATGKTTIAKHIAESCCLPLIVKDEMKEVLFDTIGHDIPGWDPDAWQKKLGVGSIELIYFLSEQLLKANVSHILESNFVPQFATPQFERLKKQYSPHIMQLYCEAQPATIMERFKHRAESGDRHPGHADHTYYDELKQSLTNKKFSPLEIDCECITIDTTDFATVDLPALTQRVKKYLR